MIFLTPHAFKMKSFIAASMDLVVMTSSFKASTTFDWASYRLSALINNWSYPFFFDVVVMR
jgi:hypothetical protein